MADTIDKTRLIISLLVEHALQVDIEFVDIGPILDSLLQMMEHIDNLDVGTTMKRTLQATDTGSDGAVGIRAGRRSNTHRKGRVVTTTMLCLDDEEQIEHTRIQLRVVLVLHHIEEVLCDREILAWMANVQASALYRVTIDVVCIGDDRWELRNQLHTLTHQVVAADIVRVRIEGVHFEHATSQDVHDVRTLQLDDVSNGTVVERHVVVQEFLESLQLLLIRQLTGKEQEGNLLKSESFLLQERSNEVVKLVATIIELTLGRLQLAILIALVTHNVTDVGQSYQHTRAILITKSTLYIELGECILINLT